MYCITWGCINIEVNVRENRRAIKNGKSRDTGKIGHKYKTDTISLK